MLRTYVLLTLALSALPCVDPSYACAQEGAPLTRLPPLSKAEFAQRLAHADDAYFAGDHALALERYQALLEHDSRRRDPIVVTRRVAITFEALGRLGEAIDAHMRVHHDHFDLPTPPYTRSPPPDNAFSSGSTWRAAQLLERVHDYAGAAALYLTYYDRFHAEPTPPALVALGFSFHAQAYAAHQRGVELLTLLGRHDEAAARLTALAATFPGASDAHAMLLWRALDAYTRARDRDGITATLTQLVALDLERREHTLRLLGAYATHPDVMRALIEPGDFDHYVRVQDLYDALDGRTGSPEARASARATLALSERDHDAWARLRFEGSLRDQKNALAAISDGFDLLAFNYAVVIAHDDPESSIEAAFRRGELSETHARMLAEADIPFPPGSEEHDLYRAQLDSLANGERREAITHYARCVDMAAEAPATPWLRLARARLHALSPADHPPPPPILREAAADDALAPPELIAPATH